MEIITEKIWDQVIISFEGNDPEILIFNYEAGSYSYVRRGILGSSKWAYFYEGFWR